VTMSSQAMIYCKMQNRLGALDRVLAAFTHRGIIPGRFASSHDLKNRAVELVVSFDCTDNRVVDKLVKFLQKQVYMLETKRFAYDAIPEFQPESAPVAAHVSAAHSAAAQPSKIASLFTTIITPERKTAHAHNA
jgi:hypothetical protein